MKKKLLSLTLGIVMVMSLVTGCGEVYRTSGNETSIQFSWWGNDNRHKYTMDGVNLFSENDPNINVEYRYGEWSGYERKNRVWMASQTQADVMQINYAWLSEYSSDGEGYYDINLLKDCIDLSSFDEEDLEYGMMNGKLNAIPIAFNMSTVCHNKELYETYGLEYPKTWDDLFEVAAVFREHDIYTIGMAKKHLLLMLIAYFEQTTGRNAFDEEGNMLLTKEDIGYILDFYKKLVDEKVIMPIEHFDKSKFADGQVASSFFWVSDADNYCTGLEDNGYTPIISDYIMDDNAKLTGIYMKPATMYSISNATEHPKEAAKLIDYLVNNEEMALLQGTEKGVPASKKAVEYLKNNGLLDTYGYIAYEEMQKEKDLLNVMIPNMESETAIDAFKQNADAYIYEVSDRDETIELIYKDMLLALNM